MKKKIDKRSNFYCTYQSPKRSRIYAFNNNSKKNFNLSLKLLIFFLVYFLQTKKIK